MGFRTWPISALGLGTLLVLVAAVMVAAASRAQEIHAQIDQVNQHHRSVEFKLRQLRDNVQVAGINARDYLLDQDATRRVDYAARLAAARGTTHQLVSELREVIAAEPDKAVQVASLATHLDEYWRTYDPLLSQRPEPSLAESVAFLRGTMVPRRRAVLALAQEIEDLNDANLARQRAEVERRRADLRRDLLRLLALSLALGGGVAVAVVVRLRVLESRADDQRRQAEEAEQALRLLSQQLVATQEEERRKLSRELHDHVGQMLTALRLELGRIERLPLPPGSGVGEAVAESRALVDEVVRTVRDLSLGLRPSMLDDFGLQPALEWHVRDFSRRAGIATDLRVEGALDGLPDQHSTCIYRLVQEALTNCARHARATRLDVLVHGSPRGVDVRVSDDGRGFDPSRPPAGLGLRGLEERVKELGGTVTLRSAPGAGTELRAHVPLPAGAGEETLATTAG